MSRRTRPRRVDRRHGVLRRRRPRRLDEGLDDAPGGVLGALAVLGSPWRLITEALRLVLVVGLGLALLMFSDRLAVFVVRLGGLTLVMGGLVALQPVVGDPGRPLRARRIGTGFGVVFVVLAVGLVVTPADSLAWAGRVSAAAGLLLAATSRIYGWRGRADGKVCGVLAPSVIAGASVVLLVIPATAPLVAMWLLAIAALVVGLIRTTAALQGRVPRAREDRRGLGTFRHWLHGQELAEEARLIVYDQVLFDGVMARSKLARFFILMALASVISAVGVLADSTAVVIGAMLVAPLIVPLMATSLSLVMGWPNRMVRAAFAALTGTGLAVGVGWLLPFVLPSTVDILSNTQITSRSSPTMLDLVVAIAAGATGAYAVSRPDVSVTLPGVAVAIALVPPLSVVGVTLQAGDYVQARGTLLLFAANAVAILFAGGLVFVLTGVAPLRRVARNQHRVRTTTVSVAVLGVLVISALSLNGAAVARDSLALEGARSEVGKWLGPETDFSVVGVIVDDRRVEVTLAGPGEPPPATELAARLAERFGREVTLDLQWIPRERRIVLGRSR